MSPTRSPLASPRASRPLASRRTLPAYSRHVTGAHRPEHFVAQGDAVRQPLRLLKKQARRGGVPVKRGFELVLGPYPWPCNVPLSPAPTARSVHFSSLFL